MQVRGQLAGDSSLLPTHGMEFRLSVSDAIYWPISQVLAVKYFKARDTQFPIIPGFLSQAFMSHCKLWLSDHVPPSNTAALST